jgi:hypothetical protein
LETDYWFYEKLKELPRSLNEFFTVKLLIRHSPSKSITFKNEFSKLLELWDSEFYMEIYWFDY